jgi:hypothetical protein
MFEFIDVLIGFVISHPILSFILFVLGCLFLIGIAGNEQETEEGVAEESIIWIEKTDFKTNHMKIIDEDVEEDVEVKIIWKVGSDNSCGTIYFELNGETFSTHTLYNIDASYFKYKVIMFFEADGSINWSEEIYEKTL